MTFDALLAQASRYRMTEQALKADAEFVFVCIRGAHADGIPHPDRVLCRRTARSRIADHPPDQTSVRRRNSVVIVDI